MSDMEIGSARCSEAAAVEALRKRGYSVSGRALESGAWSAVLEDGQWQIKFGTQRVDCLGCDSGWGTHNIRDIRALCDLILEGGGK